MNTYVADTHSLLWYISNSPSLSPAAKDIFDQAEQGNAIIIISPITVIEAIYLAEKKKISEEKLQSFLVKLTESMNYTVAPLTLDIAITIKDVSREKVPDMPDRIIVATAKRSHCKLITRDKRIREFCGDEAIW